MKAFSVKTILLWIFTILLIIVIMQYGFYLIKNDYIIECFVDSGSPETNHNVDLPINTTSSCKNVCGPLARCSITGEQCTSDVDCFGCKPKHNPQFTNYGKAVIGLNDSGKLTSGVVPQYSMLTTDIGTQSAFYDNKASKAPRYNQGVDLWTSRYNQGYNLFNNRYKPPNNLKYEPVYPTRFTMSGDFIDDGPQASNAF